MKTYSIFPSLSDLLSMIISSGICVDANGIMLFFIVTEYYFIVYMYHIFFIHLSVDGHLGCFHVLAIITMGSFVFFYFTVSIAIDISRHHF